MNQSLRLFFFSSDKLQKKKKKKKKIYLLVAFRSLLRHKLYYKNPEPFIMTSVKKKTYIVEHLDPELGPWSSLEYKSIAFESQASGSSFILSRLPLSFEVPDDISTIPSFMAEKRGVEELYVGNNKRKVCLLDPAAAKDLSPEDAEEFDVFLFGGILGMYFPPPLGLFHSFSGHSSFPNLWITMG